ncbi:allophanate hydrolase [Rhodovulum sp. DZ06]|uniref:allophanate hydrolase n=1 Tax=Rhodovulum sp. DZ06 TaxID=3425126 RepID=UPI003D327491
MLSPEAICELPFTLPALRAAYAAGATPAQVVEEVYRRIEAVGDPCIFIHLRPIADVLAEAEALGPYDPSMPLWGAPFAAKDNIDAAGIPTTAACPAWEYMPEKDAFVVGKLRAAGALLIGKTNLDQFATGLVGVRTPYGAPKNALDPEIVPGGSSGGSGVAVGHGLVTFSLGTDTAGSGRVPAALNGIVGLKPTLGTLSASGMIPACRTLDTISIFALTVADAWDAYAAAEGYDPADAFSRDIPVAPAALPPKLRIGVPDAATAEFFGDAVQEAAFEAAKEMLAGLGAEIVPLDFRPLYDVAHMLYEGAWVAERHVQIGELMAKDPEAVHPTTRAVVGKAIGLTADDAFRGIYRLRELGRVAEEAMAGLDALCVPTIPTFYTVADLEADPITPNSNLGTYTNFVNLLDMCGIAGPAPARSDGRPGSVTFLGRKGTDGLCAALAQAMESAAGRPAGATGHVPPAPAAVEPAAGVDEIELVVCGAHMSGLPLNHELTDRGARFLKAARTAPCYRLYALPGGPPKRPGLLRIERGGEIEVEVWAMPLAEMGGFMKGIPAPLTIGAVALEGGGSAKGFLVEASGVQGAEDVTRHGGWRGYLAAAE